MPQEPSIHQATGPHLRLRLIRPDDAAYVYSLRTNPAYNQHLSAVTGTVQDQRRWVEAYQAREAQGLEYYYLIERLDGAPCGTVRLYDLHEGAFTWGSWILDQNKPPKAALESACLVYTLAFERLGLEQARFDVRIDNENTLAFHRRFGATETHRTASDIYFTYPRSRFEADRSAYWALLHASR